MTPALARIKRKVRECIGLNGNISGAMATVSRGHSVVGAWHNTADATFPPLDHAVALDEVAVIQSGTAPILEAYAAELGRVCLVLPEAPVAPERVESALIAASAEFGDIAHAVTAATRDGKVCGKDCDAILATIDEGLRALVRMRAVVAAIDST